MAKADSLPTAIPGPITGAISKASTNRGSADRLYLIGGSAPYIPPIETETSLLELWRDISRRADPDNPMEEQNRRWHETITGRVPLGGYIDHLRDRKHSSGMVALEHPADPASVQLQQASSTKRDR